MRFALSFQSTHPFHLPNSEKGEIMSISGLSGTNIYQASQASWQNTLAQRQQNLKDLARALNSDDLTGAKKAFATLQQLLPNFSATIQAQNGQQGSVPNPLAVDFSALDKALKANDLPAAKEAFAKLLQDMQSIRMGNYPHHHKASAGTKSTASPTSNSGVGSTPGGSGGTQNAPGGISFNIYA
jgi:hypothetical protein